MKKCLGAAFIACLLIVSVLVVAIAANGGGSTAGEFPNRTFTVSKGLSHGPDKGILTASIQPVVDCTWWVELVLLDGVAVKMVVYQETNLSEAVVSTSKLTDTGSESEKTSLVGGNAYHVTFTYFGKRGSAVLMERTSGIPSGTTPHAPILIGSDAEFTPANGVVGGSGGISDPYVIEGWEIGSTTENCIEIRHTTAYLVIRNCFLHGDLAGQDNYFSSICNIRLSDCSHIRVDSVQATHNDLGIDIVSASDVVLSNSDFSDNWDGVHAYPATGLVIKDCIASSCYWYGIYLGMSSGFTISRCDISSNRQSGVVMYSTTNGVISDNQLSNGECAFLLSSGCTQIEFYRNTMLSDGIFILNSGPDGYTDLTIDTTNTIDGKPILHYANARGLNLEGVSVGELILGNCQDVNINGLALTGSDVGILMGYVTGATIDGCTFEHNSFYGVGMAGCSEVTIRGCTASSNTRAVNGDSCSNFEVSNCTFTRSTYEAIEFFYSNSGLVSSNTIRDNYIGIGLQGSNGIEITGNNILYSTALGINFDDASSCKVYHNNFDGMAQLAQDAGFSNQWDNGFPEGGNFWSDYTGKDSNGDGIGDVARAVPPNGVDRYPLMEPWGPTPPGPQYIEHAPIVIDGDSGFTSANGVVSGDGTWQSPYVIEGWEINISAHSDDKSLRGGILISNTNAYFVVRNCYVHSGIIGNSYYQGIALGNCMYPVIESDVVRGCAPAVSVDSSFRATVSNCLVENDVGGIYFYGVTGGSYVQYCRILDSWTPGGLGGIGVSVWDSINVSVYQNTVSNAAYIGLFTATSSDVQFVNNMVSNCGNDALRVQENVTNCRIIGNHLSGSQYGVNLWLKAFSYSPDGVNWYLCDWYFMNGVQISDNNVRMCSMGGIVCSVYTQQVTPIHDILVSDNVIANNSGEGVWLRDVLGASVYRNLIQANSNGVVLTGCVNVSVYHNNVIGNSYQASDDGANLWDNGYPSGGNYWSDYIGTDGNGDGIGDVPYSVPIANQDRYPLMGPY